MAQKTIFNAVPVKSVLEASRLLNIHAQKFDVVSWQFVHDDMGVDRKMDQRYVIIEFRLKNDGLEVGRNLPDQAENLLHDTTRL